VNKAAMDSAFMSCHTMPQFLKLLLEFNPNFYHYDYFLKTKISLAGLEVYRHVWVTMQEYRPNCFWKIKGYKEAE
jgi:hypothetical protein